MLSKCLIKSNWNAIHSEKWSFFLYFINTKIQDKTIKSKWVLVHAFTKRCRDAIEHEKDLMGKGQEKVGEPLDLNDNPTTIEGGGGITRIILKNPSVLQQGWWEIMRPFSAGGVPHIAIMGLLHLYLALFCYWLGAPWKESMALVWPWWRTQR